MVWSREKDDIIRKIDRNKDDQQASDRKIEEDMSG